MDVREAKLSDLSELIRLNDEVQRQQAKLYPHIYIYPMEAVKVSQFFKEIIDSGSAAVLVASNEHGLRGYLY